MTTPTGPRAPKIPITVDKSSSPPALGTKRLHPGVVREHREIYVRGYIAGLGSPYRRPRPPARVWLAVVLATVALVLTAFLAGRAAAAPRSAPDLSPVPTDRALFGASPPQASGLPADQRPSSGVEGSAAPSPSGEIGQPASYCKPGYCETPTPTKAPRLAVRSRGVTGTATYYCRPGISRCTRGYPFGMYAAAGPELRAMLGPDWRGRTVVVIDANGRGVLVELIDWCFCGGDHVIDLYWTAYQGLVNPVTVKEQP